jgi:hypothetical protein
LNWKINEPASVHLLLQKQDIGTKIPKQGGPEAQFRACLDGHGRQAGDSPARRRIIALDFFVTFFIMEKSKRKRHS